MSPAPPVPNPPPKSDFAQIREDIDEGFKALSDLHSHKRRPLPTQTGDGTYLKPEEEKGFLKNVESTLNSLSYLGISDVASLVKMQSKVAAGEEIDDKSYLMEGIIGAAQKLPPNSKMGETITNGFLTQLWNDLEHPPLSVLGDKYEFRTADGSYNSLKHPMLGQAGMPYARTVKPEIIQSGALPDPGLIFDSIMERPKDYDYEANKHPSRISSVLFYLASIIIHDIFHTSHEDYTISETSSYLDLAPLYGSSDADQKEVRTGHDGKLKPDAFVEKRLLSFPPGVSVLLIMFNRFHNYVVEEIAQIDEGQRFSRLKFDLKADRARKNDLSKEQFSKYDENLFQTARLITCGLYINIILIDYVRTILNLNRTDSKWQLNPRVPMKGEKAADFATGNQVSAEFNLVYRWHSAISQRDEEWTQVLFNSWFPGRDIKSVGEYELLAKFKEVFDKIEKDPGKRQFSPDIKRQADGKFNDDELVKIMKESIEDCANSFGAQRVPAVMRAIEILGIKQARAWNLATLNEFRKYFHLKPHRTFEDINPQVADQLKHLYDHPDLVEMYPGLVAESAKKSIVGSAGLAPSFTVSRAVLSDAVALVRGDRFYTVDYNPKKLTNWGYDEANFDLDVNNGCVFYKLFNRAFPDHFEPNSVYAHFPMTVPEEMREPLENLETAHLYSWDPPKFKGEHHMTFSYAAADKILADNQTYHVVWGAAMEHLMGPEAKNFMLAGDAYSNAESRKNIEKTMYVDGWSGEIRKYYEYITQKLIDEKSYRLAGRNQVDIVRDVGNLAHVHFGAEMFMLPLKRDGHEGIFSEHELYMLMTAVFAAIFMDMDPASSFPLRLKARKATQTLGKLIQQNVQHIADEGILHRWFHSMWPEETKLQHYGKHLIERLLKIGMPVHELVFGQILGTVGGLVSNQGQLFGQIMDFFLSEKGREHLPEINRLAKLDDEDSFNILLKYMLEASRLNGETAVIRLVTKDVTIEDGKRKLEFKKGERVFVNLRAASHDPEKFPEPDKLKLDRKISDYIHLGGGQHECLGLRMTHVALTAMLKVIGRLDELRPVAGPQGKVHKVPKSFGEGDKLPDSVHYHKYLTEDWDRYFPMPCSMKVNWD